MCTADGFLDDLHLFDAGRLTGMKREAWFYKKNTVIKFICTVIIIMISCPAYGYVLTGSQLLELVSGKLGKAKDFKITQKTILYDDKLIGGSVELKETVFYRSPDLFRAEIQSEETKKIHIASFDQALVVIDGKIVSEFESGFDHYKDIFAFRERLVLQKRLQLLGLDTAKVRFERENGEIVFVIGQPGSYGELYPQLFIDKKTFLPVKWLLRGTTLFGESAEPMEVVFFDWKKFRRIMYPERIEFYKNQVLIKEIKVESIKVNTGVDEALFDFEKLKIQIAAEADKTDADTPTEDKDETQKTIEGLDKIIENDRMAF